MPAVSAATRSIVHPHLPPMARWVINSRLNLLSTWWCITLCRRRGVNRLKIPRPGSLPKVPYASLMPMYLYTSLMLALRTCSQRWMLLSRLCLTFIPVYTTALLSTPNAELVHFILPGTPWLCMCPIILISFLCSPRFPSLPSFTSLCLYPTLNDAFGPTSSNGLHPRIR